MQRPVAVLALCLAALGLTARGTAGAAPGETAATYRGFPCLAWSDGCTRCRWARVAPRTDGKVCGRPKPHCAPGPIVCSKVIQLY